MTSEPDTAKAPAEEKPEVGLRPALRHRDFRLLFSGQVVSALGDWILPIAVSVELAQRNRPLQDLAWVLGARTLATGVVLLVGGVLADRFRRTRIMVAADIVRALAVLTVVLTWRDLDVVVVAGALFMFGIGEALFRPAYFAVIPRVVPRQSLGSANALNTLTQRLAAVLGPVVAGVLFAALGGPAALGVDIATFLISIVTLMLVRENPAELAKPLRRVVFSEAFEGARAIWNRDWIRYLILASLIQVAFFIAPWFVFLPIVTQDRYGGASAYTLCLSTFAIGAVVGSLAASRIQVTRPGLVGLPAVSLLALIMIGLAAPTPLWLLAAFHFLGGFGIDLFGVFWYTAVQKDVPDHLLGRVISFDLLSNKVTTPIAFALIGPVADAVGRQPILVAGALACVLPILPLLVFGNVRRLSSGRDAGADVAVGRS